MIRTLSLVAAAAVLAAAAGSPAAAQAFTVSPGFSFDPTEVVTVAHIRLADLDITSSAGARVLLERIEAAADAVCGGAGAAVPANHQADYRACRARAISGAVARAHSPALAELASRRALEQRAER